MTINANATTSNATTNWGFKTPTAAMAEFGFIQKQPTGWFYGEGEKLQVAVLAIMARLQNQRGTILPLPGLLLEETEYTIGVIRKFFNINREIALYYEDGRLEHLPQFEWNASSTKMVVRWDSIGTHGRWIEATFEVDRTKVRFDTATGKESRFIQDTLGVLEPLIEEDALLIKRSGILGVDDAFI